MGQKLIQSNKKQLIPDIDVFLLKYFPHYTFNKTYNNGMFFKTALVSSEVDGEPLIVRIYFKQDFSDSDKKLFEAQLEKMKNVVCCIDPKSVFNVAPILLCQDHLKAAMIIRQYFAHNLKERIYLMPYLTPIEKKWISFQILFAIKELHTKVCICHGDIKLENILMTSFSSVYLSDPAPFKPAYISINDMSIYTYYFGTNSNDIKSCYLAPERLIETNAPNEELYNTKPEMDIFSVGAVIAELFLEKNLFDYTKLLNYKKGIFNIQQSLSEIKDERLIEVITRMLDVNPSTRITIDECLAFFSKEICPISIPRLFIHMNTLIATSVYYKPDMMIGLIYKHWKQIWKILFGLNDAIPVLQQKLKYSLANKLIIKPSFKDVQFGNSTNKSYAKVQNIKSLIDVIDFDHLYKEDELTNDIFYANNNEESLFIILPYIFNSIHYMKYDSTIIIALEMLQHFSTKVSDNAKLQLISPYVVKIIKKKKRDIFTRSYALKILFEILHTIDYNKLILPSGDYNYFDSYAFPLILSLCEGNTEKKNVSLLLEFENSIDNLIYFEDKFLNITLKSKMSTLKEIAMNHPELIKKTQEEMFKSYDAQLAQFKTKLFNIVENCIYRTEIEILQILIKKFPKLLMFYGKKETDNFGRLLIDFFNKPGWVIQREMLKSIPEMMVSLAESDLYAYILLCFEGLIGRSVNELQIYEVIKALNYLLENDYLSSEDSIRIFSAILRFIIHPNLSIANSVIHFCCLLLSKLTKEEIMCYIQEPLSKYLYFPIVNLTIERIKANVINPLTRLVYLLEIDEFAYDKNIFSKEDEEKTDLLNAIIQNVISTPPDIPESSLENVEIFKGFNLGKFLKHKYIIMQKQQIDDEASSIEESFMSKLISFLSNLKEFSFPKIITRDDYNFVNKDGNFLGHELFTFIYLFKALGITTKLDFFNDLVEGRLKEKKHYQPLTADVIKTNITTAWRPQGQLLTTLYNNTPIEKLIMSENNFFASLDSDGGAILWQLSDKNKDGEISCDAIHNLTHQDTKYPITHSKTICSFERKNIVFASKNKLYQYQLEASKQNPQLLYSTEEGNDVVYALSSSKVNNQNITFVTRKGKLSIYDQRMEEISISNDLSIEKGMISAMTLSKDKNSIYIGTLGGYLFSYDFRLNSILDTYKYYDNTPIIGIENYIPLKGKEQEYSLTPAQDCSNYLMIYTGNVDHEIGIWNMETLHCDILFKVNTVYGIEKQALNLTIPSLTRETKSRIIDPLNTNYGSNCIFRQGNSLGTYFEYIKEYTHIYKTNQIKSLLSCNIHSGFYKDASQRLSKLLNIFEGASTVQRVVIPKNKVYKYNMHYFLSAGNDMIIRYWDNSKESLCSPNSSMQKSYLINAPNSLSKCVFSKSVYDNTVIIQSNEYYNNYPKMDMPGLSSYQNINGTTSHSSVQNEFDPSIEALRYCTKIADASHKATISDLLPIGIEGNTFLVSSSFDGSIKVWK